MRIRIRELFDPGSGMEKFGSGIEYKHPESTTLPRTVATLALAVRSQISSSDSAGSHPVNEIKVYRSSSGNFVWTESEPDTGFENKILT